VLTALVTLLLIAALGFGAFRIGQLLLGPLLSTFRWAAKSWPKPLPVPARRVLARSPSDLDDAALTRPPISERTWELEREGFRIKVRTSGNFVTPDGRPSGFPWSPEDRAEVRSVVSSTVILNLEDRGVNLGSTHVELAPPLSVSGDEGLGWALCDDLLIDALPPTDRLVVANNRISLWSPFALEHGRLEIAIDVVVRSARRLLAATYKDGRLDLPSLHADNYRHAHRPETQARAIFHLLASWPHSPEAIALGPGALEHPSPLVRYRAALASGAIGLPVLARLIDEKEVSPGVRAAALRSLLIATPPEDLDQALDRPLAEVPEEVLWVLLPMLAQRRRPEDARRLAPLLATAQGELALELARCLAVLGQAEAEPALLELYSRTLDPPTMIAAADALASVGTPAALPTLLPATRARLQPDLRLAADAAVKSIRARHPHHGPGALALIDPEARAGDVSLLPGESAALSPTPDPTQGGTGPADGRGG
jgi:HEAT repeat protein